jgi:hypothetical protein
MYLINIYFINTHSQDNNLIANKNIKKIITKDLT